MRAGVDLGAGALGVADDPAVADSVAQLERALGRRFRVTVSSVPLGDRRLELRHPKSADDLISEEDYIRDERLPYWADVWPSSLVLAARVLAMDGHGRRLLELGCGAGLVASAAAIAGFDVTATDYYDDALLFTRLNAWHTSGRAIAVRMVDWRAMPADLGRFDSVVASDVLYEKGYGALVAGAIAHTLAPGGCATVADPGRTSAPTFVEAAGAAGLRVAPPARIPYVDGAIRQTIDLYDVSWEERAARSATT